MVAVQHALIDLPMTEDVARYVSMLERKVAVLTISELKKNCLLELLTDQMWDDERFTAEDDEVRKIAETVLMKRLGMSPQAAKKLVAERWRKYQGPPPISAERGAALIADEHSDRPIPVRNQPKLTMGYPLNPPQPFDARAALMGYRQRRELTRDEVDPGTDRLELNPQEHPLQ